MHFDTITVPLTETKAAAKRGGGKLNDAFVTAVARGFRYYHDKHGATPETLRMGMPINVRTAETADLAGNQWAPTRFPVPIRVDDPLEHLQVVRGVIAVQRHEPAVGLVEPLSSVLYRLPTTVLSQCDAGLGVKNGVNRFGSKNFYGTFTPPCAIINGVLTLPAEVSGDRSTSIALPFGVVGFPMRW